MRNSKMRNCVPDRRGNQKSNNVSGAAVVDGDSKPNAVVSGAPFAGACPIATDPITALVPRVEPYPGERQAQMRVSSGRGMPDVVGVERCPCGRAAVDGAARPAIPRHGIADGSMDS